MSDHQLALIAEAHASSHSIFAPSSSSMWLNCSGSLLAHLAEPDDSSFEACEGSVAHDVADQWLRTNVCPDHLVGTNVFVEDGEWGHLITIDDDMLDHVKTYVDFCRMLPGRHFPERKVNFSRITPIPNQTGTADFIAIEPGVLHIVDFKYGKGVAVDVVGNTQAMLYALGAYIEFNEGNWFKTVRISIVQPRMGNFGDTWEISVAELFEFASYARDRAYAAWQIDAPRTPSPKACQWCRVKAKCGAAAKLVNDLTACAFDSIDAEVTGEEVLAFREQLAEGLPPAPMSTLTIEDMARLYAFRGFAEGWWKSLAAQLYSLAKDGHEIPGYKLVEARSRRYFREGADEVIIGLGVPRDAVVYEQMISPAAAEKKLKKFGIKGKALESLMSDLARKPPGKATLAPISDRRPALVDLSAVAFADQYDETPEDEEL